MFDFIKKEEHTPEVSFPILIGKIVETCYSTQVAETINLELEFYQLGVYKQISHFDPHHKMHTSGGRKYKHRVDIEDYWENFTHEFAFRRKMWSKISVDFIKRCNVFLVSDQLKYNGEHMLLQYEQERDKPLFVPI